MKPLILGKTVMNVSVDAKTIKACRTAKIKQLNKQLDELKKVDSKKNLNESVAWMKFVERIESGNFKL